MNNLREDNPILRGPAPCPPGIYRIKDKGMREEQVHSRCTCPHAFVTDCGARVASQLALSSEPAAKGYHCCIKGQEVGAT